MDSSWSQRLNNILYEDDLCLACPNCNARNPVKTLTKHLCNGSKYKHFFSMQMLKTVVCSECRQEWLPEIIVEA